MKNPIFRIQNFVRISCVFMLVFLISCSQPVLESEECIQSRDVIKKFYSYHIGNEMKPSAENLKKREIFLSDNLQKELRSNTETAVDYFTQTDDYPKAFRAGGCENVSKEKVKFEILLFWRNNETNIQREVEVETIKENDTWLVDKVTRKE